MPDAVQRRRISSWTSPAWTRGAHARRIRARVRFFADEAERRRLGVAAFEAGDADVDGEGGGGDGDDGVERREKIASEGGSTGAGRLGQFALLLRRANQCLRRDLLGVGITFFLDVLYALLLSALFRGVRDDQEGVQNRLGCLFFITLNLAYGAPLPSINLFAAEKLIVIREQASGAYTTSAYYLSKLVAELPKLSSKLLFCVIVYWTVGLNPEPARFANFVAIILCEVLAAQAVGMVMATGMPIGAALALGPACITVFTLFGGIFLNMDSIPTGAGVDQMDRLLYYVAFSALCGRRREFDDPDARFACAPGADARCLPDGRAVLELYSFEDVTVGTQIAAQLALAAGLQCLAYALLVRGTSRFLPLRMRSERDRESERDGDDGSAEQEGTSAAGCDWRSAASETEGETDRSPRRRRVAIGLASIVLVSTKNSKRSRRARSDSSRSFVRSFTRSLVTRILRACPRPSVASRSRSRAPPASAPSPSA